jgi:hypothetical protein
LLLEVDNLDPCQYNPQTTHSLENGVSYFVATPPCEATYSTPCSACGTSGSSGTGTTTSTRYFTREDALANLKQCDYKSGVLDVLFGPSEKCIQHFSNERRMKVKTWNTNYLLYKSIGLKVKGQKKGDIWHLVR